MQQHHGAPTIRLSLLSAIGFCIALVSWICSSQILASPTGTASSNKVEGVDETPAPKREVSQEAKRRQRDGNMPLRKIVAYTAGVSYYEHSTTLNGAGRLKLSFDSDDMSDVLKSLVVYDEGGGAVQLAAFPSQTPIEHTLDSFAIDLADNPSLVDLLKQIRGTVMTVRAPEAVTGRLVSVEKRAKLSEVDGDNKEPLAYEWIVNLRVDRGIKPIHLDNIDSIELADDQLDQQLSQALEALAVSQNDGKKTVALQFSGKAEREVSVGYVRESPVWKMTYRPVLNDQPPHKLHGWAIVENTTGEDWKDVFLTFVSGQPITYEMPLYQPLFVDRPTVELDLYEGLRPQTYGQNMAGEQAAARGTAKAALTRARANALADPALRSDRMRSEKQSLLAESGFSSQAVGSDVGELFEYRVESPISLERHHSAMIPVLAVETSGERYSVYEQTVHSKHPLYGVRLHNTSQQYLMEGPITVFEAGRYAGDALHEGLAAGSQRLVTFGIDLDVEVSPHTTHSDRPVRSVRVSDGILHASRVQYRELEYTIKNSGETAKQVLVVVPKQAPWELVTPEPSMVARDQYRFLVKVEAGETKDLAVTLRQTISQQFALADVTTDQLALYLQSDAIDPAIQDALAQIAKQKRDVARLQDRIEQLKSEIESIRKEQERIRSNLAEIDRNTDLYSRYIEKLGEQEDRLESLHKQIESLQADLRSSREELSQSIRNLDLGAQQNVTDEFDR